MLSVALFGLLSTNAKRSVAIIDDGDLFIITKQRSREGLVQILTTKNDEYIACQMELVD